MTGIASCPVHHVCSGAGELHAAPCEAWHASKQLCCLQPCAGGWARVGRSDWVRLAWHQAGASALLQQPDATGSVPAALAREKGHRFLAHYLEEYRSRHDGSQWCGRQCLSATAFCMRCSHLPTSVDGAPVCLLTSAAWPRLSSKPDSTKKHSGIASMTVMASSCKVWGFTQGTRLCPGDREGS